MTTAKVIRTGRLQLGLTEQEFADLCGVSRGSVQQWESGATAPKRKNQPQVAKVLGITVAQLMHGTEPLTENAVGASIGSTRVPLISPTQAADLNAIMDGRAQEGATEYLLTDLPVSPRTFALEIKGFAMSPEFKEGDRVIIDPMVRPEPGDFVAASRAGAQGRPEAVFKKYRPRGVNEKGAEVFELAPLNPDHPSMLSDRQELHILGTMVEHRRYRKALS